MAAMKFGKYTLPVEQVLTLQNNIANSFAVMCLRAVAVLLDQAQFCLRELGACGCWPCHDDLQARCAGKISPSSMSGHQCSPFPCRFSSSRASAT